MTWLNSSAVQKFHDDLAEIPTLYADLPAILTGIKGQSGGVHTPPGSKPPLAVHVVDLLDTHLKDPSEWAETDPRDRLDEDEKKAGIQRAVDRWGIVPRIAIWVRVIDEEMDEAGEHMLTLEDADWHDIGALCAAIKTATSWIITQQWVTELALDIRDMKGELRSTLGIRPEFIPKCRYCLNKCEPQDNGTWFRCPACGADFTWQGEVAALIAVQDGTGPQVAAQLGISWERIRQWKARGLVTKVGKDARGRDLFSIDAVARVYRDISAGKISIKEEA